MNSNRIIAVLFIILLINFSSAVSSFSDEHYTISPHDSNIYNDSAWDDAFAGIVRTFTGLLPGDFKENEQENIGYGTFSSRVFVASNTYKHRLKISCTDLTSGSNIIPAASIKYMYTYGGITGDAFSYRNAPEAPNSPAYNKYVPFSNADTLVYQCGSTTFETPSPGYINWEHQFKYAIQVPNNAAAGTYSGIITYTFEMIGGSTKTLTCQIQVAVGSYFRLSVDRGSIDFEKMKPGETKDNVPVEGVIITSKTNVGNPWYLKISNDAPLSCGPYIIPNSNFIWYGWTDGSGTWYGHGTDQMTLVPMLAYSSGANEGNNLPDGTKNHLKFKLTISKGQPGGKYISNVRLTMTE